MPLGDATLVIAKLDRLSRDAHFLLGLQKAGVRFVAADMPEANEMVVGIMAVVAEAERKMISARTKAALAAVKARGVRLGGDRGSLASVSAQGRAVSLAVRQEAARLRARDLSPVISEYAATARPRLRRSLSVLTRSACRSDAFGLDRGDRCGEFRRALVGVGLDRLDASAVAIFAEMPRTVRIAELDASSLGDG